MLVVEFPGIRLLMECESEREAVDLYRNARFDWVLMDINLAEGDGFGAAHSILEMDSSARVLMLTIYDDEEYRRHAHRIGVKGYILKENLDEVVQIIRSVSGVS